uniref:Aldehyde dehydrogenase domain-containing protein n=1 Tax=Odontella aurita TaxID=265563 RepID=A0A7S4HV61_9STRA
MVKEPIYNEFVRKLVDKTKVFRMGDPENMDMSTGPVITEKQLHYIERKVDEGIQSDPDTLQILCRGKRCTGFEGEDAHLNEGNWYEPTVVAARLEAPPDEGSIDRLQSSDVLFQSELFSLVVALVPFHSLTQAVRLANGTLYGLGCSIWTSDLSRAHRTPDAVHAGIVWINDHHKNHPSSPWGSLTKASGVRTESMRARSTPRRRAWCSILARSRATGFGIWTLNTIISVIDVSFLWTCGCLG